MMKPFAIGSACLMLASAALAQAPAPPSTPVAGVPPVLAQEHQASRLIGIGIKSIRNESIGEITDLLIEDDGRIKGVVVAVGGFLGFAEHRKIMRFDQIRLVRDVSGRLFVLSHLNRAELQALPEWIDKAEPVRSR